MDRVLQGVTATLTQTVLVNETGTDPSPDSATVTITRADGTNLYTDTAATNGPNGGFTFTLTPLDTALLDTLTATWKFTLGGQIQSLKTTTEIVGGYHFGLDELRQMDPLQDQVKYPMAKLIEARTLAETALEDACGVAFVPRYSHRTVQAYGDTTIDLGPKVRLVRSATLNGVASDVSTLTYSAGLAVSSGTWTSGVWTIGWEHGYDSCPPWVARASMLLARHFLVESPIDDRFSSVSTQDGTFSMVTPGMRGALFAIPEINAVVDQYRYVAI